MGKIDRGSQMGAWHQYGLADWLSVVVWLWLCDTIFEIIIIVKVSQYNLIQNRQAGLNMSERKGQFNY
jgi:hypothetical protein